MFSKDEIKALKANFWSAFEKRMKKHRSASSGSKVNWGHYKTNINHLYFRIETGSNSVAVCIDVQHKDTDIRHLFYEQFTELKTVMQGFFKTELDWQKDVEHSNGRTISRISTSLENANYLEAKDSQRIIDFLEESLVALDAFWSEYNEILYQLK